MWPLGVIGNCLVSKASQSDVRCMTMKDYPGRKMVYCKGGVSSLEAVSRVRRYLKYYKVVDTELGPKKNKSKEERYEGENVKIYGI